MLSMVLNEATPPPPPPPPEAASTVPPAPRFSTYLMPSLSRPFRRHHVTASSGNAVPAHGDIPSLSNSPTDSIPSSPAECPPASASPSWFSNVKHGFRRRSTEQSNAPRLTRIQPDTIRCSTCGTDFAFYSQIVSKGFTGRYGRAVSHSPSRFLVLRPSVEHKSPLPSQDRVQRFPKPSHIVLELATTDLECSSIWLRPPMALHRSLGPT
ncbi:hypothetical protein F5B21DRAFT_173132 [Xylaria acuta]|nr:hypothetical protein F5B21DRAFT_173132 [Xylaria acuta]